MSNNQQPAAATNTEMVKKELNVVDQTLQRVLSMQENKELQLPKDYSAANALKSAWLILQDKPELLQCTRESIAYALLSMVVQGLNPVKHQCSFIKYGSKLTLQREYQGSIAIAKRVGLKSVVANAVFEGDEFEFQVNPETGRKQINKHVSSISSFGGEVKGAYAVIEMNDGQRNVEVMSIAQIRKAWEQGSTKGNSPAHKNFPDQMACKTVINRAVKGIINSSDDAALFEEEEQTETAFVANVQHEIDTKANGADAEGAEIGFEDHEYSDVQGVLDQTENEKEKDKPEVKPNRPF